MLPSTARGSPEGAAWSPAWTTRRYALNGAAFTPLSAAAPLSITGNYARLTLLSDGGAFAEQYREGIPLLASPFALPSRGASSLSSSLPPAAAPLDVMAAVCMYNEDGYTLARTVQSLAMQQFDLQQRRHRNKPDSKLLHVWAICDGYHRTNDAGKASRILQPSASRAIMELYGAAPPVRLADGDVAAAKDPLESLRDDVWGVGRPGAEVALLEVVSASTGELAGLPINVQACLRSDSREGGVERESQFDNEGCCGVPPPGSISADGVPEGSEGSSSSSSSPRPATAAIQPAIYFSVLIKRKNARKHDSHKWFFEVLGRTSSPPSSSPFSYSLPHPSSLGAGPTSTTVTLSPLRGAAPLPFSPPPPSSSPSSPAAAVYKIGSAKSRFFFVSGVVLSHLWLPM